MQTVREIASVIVAREGGFVNDPDDPGGATKFGVTIHTMRRLGLDLTGDGAVDVADVRRLSRAQAEGDQRDSGALMGLGSQPNFEGK